MIKYFRDKNRIAIKGKQPPDPKPPAGAAVAIKPSVKTNAIGKLAA